MQSHRPDLQLLPVFNDGLSIAWHFRNLLGHAVANYPQPIRPPADFKNKQFENRVPAQRGPLTEKLKAALAEKTAPPAAIPGVLRKLFGQTAQAARP